MNVLMLFLPEPGVSWLVVIAIIFLLLFGGSKLPELAKAIGKSKRAFKEGLDEGEMEAKEKSDSRAKLESVDDEALFEEARRRAQQIRAGDGKRSEDEKLLSGK